MPESKKKRMFDISEIIEKEPDILKRMVMTDFSMALLKDPDDAFLSNNLPERFFLNYAEARIKAIAQTISNETGADPEQIINPDTRTPEQQKLVLELSEMEQRRRLTTYLHSNYLRAVVLIAKYAEEHSSIPYNTIWDDDPDTDAEEESDKPFNIPRLAALYFFALHTDIKPQDQNAFDDEANQTELMQIFDRMDALYVQNREFLTKASDFLSAFVEAEKPADAEQIITDISQIERIAALAKRPDYNVVPNTLLMNLLTRKTRELDANPEGIVSFVADVSRRGAKTKVLVTCVLSYEGDNIKITGKRPFTEYDRNVYNAVVSLYVAGNKVITIDMVWRAMLGKTEQEQATPAQQAAVEASLDKLRFMRAVIDCSAEFEMRNITLEGDRLNGGGYDDNMLHLKNRWVKTAAGKIIRAYEILSCPIMYEYSAAVRQVQTVDIKMLDVKKLDSKGNPTTHSLEYTDRRVIIKGYLMRRIEGMKGNNNLDSRCIALLDYKKGGEIHEGLYTIAGSPELSQPAPDDMTGAQATKRKNDARYIREDAEAMLKYWKAVGYIKGYSTYKSKGVNAGFEIAP